MLDTFSEMQGLVYKLTEALSDKDHAIQEQRKNKASDMTLLSTVTVALVPKGALSTACTLCQGGMPSFVTHPYPHPTSLLNVHAGL